jgi:hypothetical protein
MFGLNRPVGTFVVDDVLYSLFDKPGIDLSVDTDMIDIVVDVTCHPYLSVVALYMYVQSDHYLTEPLSELYMYGPPLSVRRPSVNFSYILQMTKTSSL